jgi:hypothetical protein
MIPERTIRGFLHLVTSALFSNGTRTTLDLVICWREAQYKASYKPDAADKVINFGSYLIEKYRIGAVPILLVDWQSIMENEGFYGE